MAQCVMYLDETLGKYARRVYTTHFWCKIDSNEGQSFIGGSACKQTAIELVRNKWSLSRYSSPLSPHRLKLLILGNIFNWGLAALPWYGLNDNFSSYLLIIFLGNLGFYLIYYILMKILSGERILWLPLLLILLSIVSWTASGYFFFQRSTNWKKSPAQSREFNKGCQLLNFYDNHDIWHLLSATSIFLSYMVLLTWDDDLRNTDRCNIEVF